jgi:hypothetical protein
VEEPKHDHQRVHDHLSLGQTLSFTARDGTMPRGEW